MTASSFTALIATIRKELLLLRRDIHGLLLLFMMPIMFILIMSLALQNQFAEGSGSKIHVLVEDRVHDAQSAAILEQLRTRPLFDWQLAETDTAEAQMASQQKVSHDEVAFLLRLQRKNTIGLKGVLSAEIIVAPATHPQVEAVLTAAVSEAITRQRIEKLLLHTQSTHNAFALDNQGDEEKVFSSEPVTVNYSYKKAADKPGKAPTSVQQSVPAWLVFAIFFAVVPLSNALITERQQGTLRRLRTMPVPPFLPIVGKLIPYFFINQLQVVLMLMVGVYVMPWFGADRLTLGDSFAGLALMSASISVAALGYGILIAVVARTTDQATTLGGTGNIILAAIGGIMVPRFVMPEMMQQISQCSPMAWGLEGFLDILLRNGGVVDVLPEAGALLLLGCFLTGMALLFSLRKYQ